MAAPASAPPSDPPAVDGPAVRIPKYYALKQRLLAMTAGHQPGAALPTERELSARFGVSRTTVRQALHELTVEGRLHRQQGRGTFVAAPKVAQSLQLTSFTEDMRAQGRRPASRLLDVGTLRADAELAARLGLPTGGRVLRLVRLRLADDEPLALETAHLPARRFADLSRRLRADPSLSLYRLLEEEYAIRLADADERIGTVLAEPQPASLLRIDVGSPVLRMARLSWDQDGMPVEYVLSLYRGDRFEFVTRLHRPAGAVPDAAGQGTARAPRTE